MGGGDKTGKPSGTTGGGNTSDPLASIGQSISDNVGNSVTSSINETNARILGEVEQQGADNLAARTEAQQAQQNADFDEVIVANQNASAQRASDFVARSEALNLQGNILASQSLHARQASAERIQQSFDAGRIRGEASYLNGVANRSYTGVDAKTLVQQQTAGYLEFRQNQQAKFDQFYGDLNTVERFAFDKGVDFSEFVLGTYEAVGNGVEVGIEAGKMVANGADVRLAVGFKNSENFEVKAFAGTDIAGFSHKGGLFENKIASNSNLLQPLKTNVATRFVVDTFGTDGFNPRLDFVQEFDSLKLDTSGLSRRAGFIDSEATFGLRRNLTTLENRASLNIKFELPDAVERFTFGWTPTVSLEFRSK